MISRFFGVLMLVGSLWLVGCASQEPPPKEEPPPPPPPPPVVEKTADASELAFLPESTIQLAVLRVGKILSQLPITEESKARIEELKENSSIDLGEITELSVVGIPQGEPAELVQGMILRSNVPLDPTRVLAWLGNPPSQEEVSGKTLHVREGESPTAVHFADAKTVLFGNKDVVVQMLGAKDKPEGDFTKLAEKDAGAFDISLAMNLIPVRETISDTVAGTRMEFRIISDMLKVSDTLTMAINLEDRFEGDVFFRCKDARATQGVRDNSNNVKKLFSLMMPGMAKERDPTLAATAKFILALMEGMTVHGNEESQEVRIAFRDETGKVFETLVEIFPIVQKQMFASTPAKTDDEPTEAEAETPDASDEDDSPNNDTAEPDQDPVPES